MLNYRSASITAIILAALVFLLMIFLPGYWWLLLPVAALYLLILAWGSANIRSGFYLKAFCRGDTPEKLVALTFDDGPDQHITPKILEILEKHHIPATFFLIGNKAENQQELVRLILSKGHRIGLHSYSHHFFFDLFGRKKMEQDLLKAEGILMNISGEKPRWFRPPYGVTNPAVAKVVRKLGYYVIGWSVKSNDTACIYADKITRRVSGKLAPGAVVLMHDTQEVTPGAAEMIISKAKDEGYRFVFLEEIWRL